VDIRDVERYILIGAKKPKKGTLRQKFLSWGSILCFVTALIWFFAFTNHRGFHGGVFPWFHFAAIAVILLPFIWCSILLFRYGIKSYSGYSEKDVNRHTNKAAIGAGFGVILAFILLNVFSVNLENILLQDNGTTMLSIAGFIPLLIACSYFYKAYLIKEFCPYLETPDDRRFNRDDIIDDQNKAD